MPSENIFTVAALGPPAIPVRSTSPLPLRATVPTEVAFGRHQSPPPPQRPGSPERLDRPFRRFDGQPACENGCPRPACFWCDRCEIQLCGACDAGIHDRNAALRRHERVHLLDRLEMCAIHREGKRLFCSECTTLVCQRCVATDLHKFPDGRGHPIFDMDTAANARRPEILDMARQIDAVAAHAPQTLDHLNSSLLSVQAHIDSVCERLRGAVDAYQTRMTQQLHDYLKGDVELLERFIASTAASRGRLELDVQNAQSLASRDTPPQTFLQQWRDLRAQLTEDVKTRLGQPEPEGIKMNVELTGQVQSGRIMTLEMEIQRVLDALDKCGQIVNVPRNGTGRSIPLSPPSSPSK